MILYARKSNFLGVWEGLRPPMSNFKGQQENLFIYLFSLVLLHSADFERRNIRPEFLTLYLFVLRNG